MIADLAAWLLADDGPIAEDERVAQAANPAPWRRITDKEHLDPLTIFGDGIPRGFDKLRNVASLEYSWEKEGNAAHITRWDPARVLAECAAKRKIIEEHAPEWRTVEWPHDQDGKGNGQACRRCQNAEHTDWRPSVGQAGVLPDGFVAPYVLAPCVTLLALAQPYAGRPGWDERWRA